MEIKKYFINNEKGSGTVIVMVGLVITALFFGLLFFDFSNVFINKRVTQTGADSAAIAAAMTANKHMKADLQEETQEELDDLGDEWDVFKELEDVTLSDFVDMVESRLRKSMPSDIRSWLNNHSVKVNAETAMKFFYEDDEVNDMSCKAVLDHWDDAKDSAEEYAIKNQNDKVTDIEFIKDDFRIYVETERKGKYTTVSDDSIPPITSESSARIGEPKGYEGKISCS